MFYQLSVHECIINKIDFLISLVSMSILSKSNVLNLHGISHEMICGKGVEATLGGQGGAVRHSLGKSTGIFYT